MLRSRGCLVRWHLRFVSRSWTTRVRCGSILAGTTRIWSLARVAWYLRSFALAVLLPTQTWLIRRWYGFPLFSYALSFLFPLFPLCVFCLFVFPSAHSFFSRFPRSSLLYCPCGTGAFGATESSIASESSAAKSGKHSTATRKRSKKAPGVAQKGCQNDDRDAHTKNGEILVSPEKVGQFPNEKCSAQSSTHIAHHAGVGNRTKRPVDFGGYKSLKFSQDLAAKSSASASTGSSQSANLGNSVTGPSFSDFPMFQDPSSSQFQSRMGIFQVFSSLHQISSCCTGHL